jgi:hypothetical protein
MQSSHTAFPMHTVGTKKMRSNVGPKTSGKSSQRRDTHSCSLSSSPSATEGTRGTAPRVLNRGAGSKWGCGPCQIMSLAKWSSSQSRRVHTKLVVDGVTLQWQPSYESVAFSTPSPHRHCSIITYKYRIALTTRIAQSVQRLATGWTVRGSKAGGGEIFSTCPDWP